MYLQITEKCNMTCEHCCYSCDMQGQHMPWGTLVDAVAFIRDYNDHISIGGGEPTLHPDFFKALKICLDDFDYVWLATNGSQTAAMYRLADIIDGCDWPDCDCEEEQPELFEEYGCLCHEKMEVDVIYQEEKLGVALSQDHFHDPIDQGVVDLWNRRANRHGPSHFEIRDVARSRSGIIAEGRAVETGSGWNTDDCVCADVVIKIDGSLRLCGCTDAPKIGDIWNGIDEYWEGILNDEIFREADCWKRWAQKLKEYQEDLDQEEASLSFSTL